IVKTDKKLKQQWFSAFGGKYDDRLFCLAPAGDNGVAAAGYSGAGEGGNNDAYLVVVDKKGNLMFSGKYGLSGRDEAYGIAAATDGGFVLSGITGSYTSANDTDGLLIRTDAVGNSLWVKNIGGRKPDEFQSVAIAPDGSLIMCGTTASFGSGMTDMLLIKCDPKGNTEWIRAYGGKNGDSGNMAVVCPDGGYACVGMSSPDAGNSSADIYVVRTDNMGNSLWAYTYGAMGLDQGKSITVTRDGGFVIGATSESYSYGSTDIYVFKIDSEGRKVWESHFGGKEDEYCANVIGDLDGGFIVAGWTAGIGAGEYDGYMLKTDKDGKIR
ncbi:MAG: hypothetical protein LLG37_03485, partial [Spirochaetia bacterium]|nr:hypothetical protein [Spirochaetia bacterium]